MNSPAFGWSFTGAVLTAGALIGVTLTGAALICGGVALGPKSGRNDDAGVIMLGSVLIGSALAGGEILGGSEFQRGAARRPDGFAEGLMGLTLGRAGAGSWASAGGGAGVLDFACKSNSRNNCVIGPDDFGVSTAGGAT